MLKQATPVKYQTNSGYCADTSNKALETEPYHLESPCFLRNTIIVFQRKEQKMQYSRQRE